MTESSPPLDRHFTYIRRQMLLGFVFHLALGIGTVAAMVSTGLELSNLTTPTMAFLGVSAGLYIVLRRTGWLEPDPDGHSIDDDEWVQESYSRARKVALQTVFFGQVALIVAMPYLLGVPSIESAVLGMAILTMVLVGITFHGGFLYFSRLPVDG